jgi:hypothetical protein
VQKKQVGVECRQENKKKVIFAVQMLNKEEIFCFCWRHRHKRQAKEISG